MKIRRCALVAAVVMTVCTVVFLCRNKSSDEMVNSISGEAPETLVPSSSAVAAVASAPVLSSSNQTETVRGTKPYVLTCERNFNKSLRLAAEALGVRTVGVLDRKSLLVEADAAALGRLAADGRFTVKEELLPSEKIAPSLAALIAGGAKDVEVSFVTLSPDDRRIVQGRIVSRGGEILKGCFNERNVFSARLPASLVSELASCGDVRWMERFDRPHLMNDHAVDPEAMNVRAVWLSDENLDGLSGTNQVVSTSDSGIDTGDLGTMHADLRAQILDMKPSKTDKGVDCDMFDSNGHGTHTAGSIVGDGTLSEGRIRGTAWAAKLCVWFCGKDGTRSVYTPEACAELFRGDAEGTAWNAYIHSASWGSDTAGDYTVKCMNFDEYLWSNPDFLPVVSAGNAGSGVQTVGSPAAAKNVLAVGATLNQPKGDPVNTASFSSRGPCADGRIKPDIAAPGDSVTSTRSTMVTGDETPYEPYTAMSGTSMSCPLTAGAVALMREWLVDRMGFSNAVPSAALMKAVITGGAKGAEMPGNDQGWGRVDLAETLFPSNRAVKLIDRIPFAAGEEFSWDVETDEDAPLDVQLAWVDFPGVAREGQTAPQLVNDLDLAVTSLQGEEVHYGNGGDSPDTLNNIESVRLESAEKGRYRITVTCKDLPYDFTDGGAAALYIRGAFDPDDVREHYTVRVVRPSAEPKAYARLDRALNEAKDGDVIEILEETELRENVRLANEFALTLTATNANPRASRIVRRKGVEIRVENGSLLFTNLAFRTEATTPVRAWSNGVVRVAGIAEFDDIVSGVPGVLTDRPAGFDLAGRLTSGITVECEGASQTDAQFGVYSCDFTVARESAPRLISKYNIGCFGAAEESGILKWTRDAPVDPAVAVGYVDGEVKTYYRTLDDLFDVHTAGTNVVIMKSGARLAKPRTLRGVQSIAAAADAVDGIVLHPEGTAGFTLDAGCDLTVSGITFEGYTGNGLFIVDGENAKLTVTNSAFRNIEGTSNWSGAIAILRGKAVVRAGSVFDNCRATGSAATKKGKGGAIYLGGGCELELEGCSIINCYATLYGGGVYVIAGSSVSVRGALTVAGNSSKSGGTNRDDIYLQSPSARLSLSGRLVGMNAIGVRYGSSGSGWGNGEGDRLAKVAADMDWSDAKASAKAFFHDTNSELRAEPVADGTVTNLIWVERTDEVPWVEPGKDSDATVRVTKGGDQRDYFEPAGAFGWIDADATVEILKDVSFEGDLVIPNGVSVTLFSTNESPYVLSRSTDVLIQILSGASLTVTNLVIDGNSSVKSSGLIKADGGSLDLRSGTTVRNVRGITSRDAAAVSIQNKGSFTLRSGARIVNCRNGYVNPGSKASYGGGVLVEEGSTANLLGGSVTRCSANRGGGVFIGTKSRVRVSGDVTVTGNTSASGVDNLCVADLSQDSVVLTGPFTGAIGYNEGRSGDTDVFGRVEPALVESAPDVQVFAHRFTHDFTGDIGMAVSNGSETLLMWGSALDENGRYGDYEWIEGAHYEVFVPVGHSREYDGTPQQGVDAGIGYRIVSGNEAVDAGTYTSVVRTLVGFAWTGGATGDTNVTWNITRAEYVLMGVTFEDKTFEYDGSPKTNVISGTLPAGLKVVYENNIRWQPGTNDVTACISGSMPNYVPDPFTTNLSAKLIITDPEGKFKPFNPQPDPKPHWEVVTNRPSPIAFESIDRVSDTEWTLVITNREPYCNYRLIWTDDLTKGFTSTGDWEKASGTVDPVWTTNFITTGGAWFWRAEGAAGTNMVLKAEE